jgi:hypothetical protein
MNDFSEIENELKKLHPAQPSADLTGRIERALGEQISTITAGVRWRKFLTWEPREATWKVAPRWLALGLGLTAAALFLMLARVNVDRSPKRAPSIASITPIPVAPLASNSEFIPAGLTQVVYQTRDEGLHFRKGAAEPVRRVRSRTRETLQWRNPGTGASLLVSYPAEQVELIPISGQ